MAFLKSTAPACLFVLVSILASPITAAVLQNYTIALPKGSSDHGEPGLLCTPAKAVDLLTFYLLNYVAHAATVLTRPGERADDYLVTVIGSLLFPSLGLYRGVEAILCGAVFTKNDNLRKAARSGALCIVVRGADWRPENGESVSNVILKRASTALENGVRDAVEHRQPEEIVGEKDIHLITYNPPYIFSKFACPVFAHRRIIHGAYSLPAGYSFAIVPHDAQFVNLTGSATSHPTIEVSATYNMVKAVAALAQSAYALYTLYRARGDQISQFGYAAFGLTVAPYAVMSIMNLVGNLCRPEYPSLYLVESSIMDEARRRGGLFEGAVAKIREFESRTVTASDLPGAEDIDDLHFSSTITGETVAHFSVPPTKWQQTNTPTNNPSPTIPEKLSPISTPTQTELIQHSIPIAPLPPGLNYHNTQPPFTLFIPCHTPLINAPTTTTTSPQTHSISSISLHRYWPPMKFSLWTQTYHPQYPPKHHHPRATKYLLTTLISLLPLLLVALLSHFHLGTIPPRDSSTWRAFTTQWLCGGVLSGLWFVWDQERKDALCVGDGVQRGPGVRGFIYFMSAAPAIGGFIVVGQMVVRYGVCAWVGD